MLKRRHALQNPSAHTEGLLPIAACASALVVFILQIRRLIPDQNGLLGHDYSYFLPYLLLGLNWIKTNGWFVPPHFTPDFCGGVPWLANPQSMFYSLPQALMLIADPLMSLRLAIWIYGLIGVAAIGVLLRHCFQISWYGTSLGAILFLLNGFFMFRAAIGHLTYHTYGLVPLVIVFCLLPFASNTTMPNLPLPLSGLLMSCAIGCSISLMVYGGALNYMVPLGITAAAVIIIFQTKSPFHLGPWIVLAGGSVLGCGISALKLAPSIVFAAGFGRHYLHTAMFDDPTFFATTLLRSLFAPNWLPQGITVNSRPDSLWLGLHEFEFGVSVVPLVIIIGGALKRPIWRAILKSRRAIVALITVLGLPIVGTFGSESWGRFLESVPIVQHNTTLTRWWSIYSFVIIIWAAIWFDRIFTSWGTRRAGLIVCAGVCMFQVLTRNLDYYSTSNVFPRYDPTPITKASQLARNAGWRLPDINQVARPSRIAVNKRDAIVNSPNDGLLGGISFLPCYEPIFGYWLELFPNRRLLDAVSSGQVSKEFVDPRCYLDGTARSCRGVSTFVIAEASEMNAFLAHGILKWQEPQWMLLARWITLSCLLWTVGVFVVAGIWSRL